MGSIPTWKRMILGTYGLFLGLFLSGFSLLHHHEHEASQNDCKEKVEVACDLCQHFTSEKASISFFSLPEPQFVETGFSDLIHKDPIFSFFFLPQERGPPSLA